MTWSIKNSTSKRLSLFRKDEEGSMVVFTMFLILMMILMGGIAVDMMRFETYRARLQSSVDRAVLAAANLDSCLDLTSDPADVVRDFVAKNGFADQVGDIVVTRNANSCTVTAEARLDVNTIFMSMVGVDQLGAPAASGATESIGDVEISLVLDVSGSMGRQNRIERMRDAANEFVATMTESVDNDRLSISVVPYSTTVSIGPDLMSQYTLNAQYSHNQSFCLDLPSSTYNSPTIPANGNYIQSGHFDADGGASYNNLRAPDYWTCNPDPISFILPLTSTLSELQTHISALEPDGWTSIEMGANWGLAMLDPGSRAVVSGLIADGVVNARYVGRPLDYDPTENLKVLVLMTDGENTRDYVLSTAHRNQLSDVWLFDVDGDQSYSFQDEVYFVQDTEISNWDQDSRWNESYYRVEWDSDDYLNGAGNRRDVPRRRAWTNNIFDAEQQTWAEVFETVTIRSHAWNFRGDQRDHMGTYYDWYSDIITTTYSGTKDARLASICTEAKDEGVVVYTIGFEVTDRAATVMSNCATSPNHFYRVEGLEITAAFQSIASQISALRLIQ